MCNNVWLPEEHIVEVGGQDFLVLREEHKFCPHCYTTHKILTVIVTDRNMVDGGWVNYTAIHCYCATDRTFFDTEDTTAFNRASMMLERMNQGGRHERDT